MLKKQTTYYEKNYHFLDARYWSILRCINIILLMILVLAASCSDKLEKERKVLASLLGKEITLPGSLDYRIQDIHIDYPMNHADFKIVTYIDSNGCTACRMKLQEWDRYINSVMSLDDVDVAFLMILNTKKPDEISHVLAQYQFNHPVAVDSDNLFFTANTLLSENAYHTLLLDADNKVVAVGNPVMNPKVREVYDRIIKGEDTCEKSNFCLVPVEAIGALNPCDTIVKRFAVHNTSETPLTIQEIVPSCNCLAAVASSSAVVPGSTEFVTVTFTADSVVGPFKRYVDIFYKEKDNPERITLHGFVINKPNY